MSPAEFSGVLFLWWRFVTLFCNLRRHLHGNQPIPLKKEKKKARAFPFFFLEYGFSQSLRATEISQRMMKLGIALEQETVTRAGTLNMMLYLLVEVFVSSFNGIPLPFAAIGCLHVLQKRELTDFFLDTFFYWKVPPRFRHSKMTGISSSSESSSRPWSIRTV